MNGSPYRDDDTREAWLRRAVDALRPKFDAAGYALPPNVHVSVGFPSRGALRGTRMTTVGQCWNGAASADKAPHIFISPLHDTAVGALDTLTHELVHAALPARVGHKGPFKRACLALGLTEGTPKTASAGAELRAELERLNAALGPWSHAALDARKLSKAGGTRLVKVCCAECGYTARVTRVWLDGPGAPVCPADATQMEEA